MGEWIGGGALGIVFVAVLVLARSREAREIAVDALRDGVPLCLFWLGLRLMSRKTRRSTIYSIQRRHTLRGIPDAYIDNPA